MKLRSLLPSINRSIPLTCQALLFITVLTLFTACAKENNQKFYEDIQDSPLFDSDIKLIGGVTEMPVKSQALFVPDNVKSGGYAYATVVRMNDSSLMIACTRYKPNGFDDFMHSDIVARKSTDNGKTWSPEFVLQENIATINTMNPNLLRVGAKKLLLIFTVKHSDAKIDLYVKESADNGETWGDPRTINTTQGYHILNNDRAILNNKRIILPVAYAKNISKEYDQQVIFCYYSDDMGKTWLKSKYLKTYFALMEPGVTPIDKKGTLKMNIRTRQGFIYFSKSTDNGATWSGLYRSGINTPESPQVVKSLNCSDSLIMIWNNAVYTPGYNNRNPLTFAYSVTGGNEWINPTNLRSNRDLNYLYPTIYNDRNDTVFVTYAIRDNSYKPMVYLDKLSLKNLIK
ncbi:sialidase family protein [Chitinophaga sp. CF418]|uniref:sialidase family protein n=1 Tax=Chitinophaga sp. CF418 TaxID=1855287 RepID=UPI0009248BD5|nr:sialidase family protein [Chitinophaga sp. CF418]SHN44863.1 BNR repeat-like domain-containing protein [Chitinophaga sp. CF418]